jgi:hypothetical protein
VRRPRSNPATNQVPDQAGGRGVEFAWKVHNAQEGWTGRVDGKAALYLATQVAVIVAMVAALPSNKPLGRLSGANHWLAIGGLAISMLAVIVAGLAVIPMLNSRKTLKANHKEHLIYFGHLRHWKPDDLRSRLRALTEDDELNQLSLQLVALSKINWRKHRFLQAAMIIGALGALVVLGAYVQTRI